MTDESEINIFRALDYIKANAKVYAKAKADRIYLENYRKSKKALLMRKAEMNGKNAIGIQEREAYADEEYILVLEGLREATEEEERLRWLMVAAQASIEVWRTMSASKRQEAKQFPS